MSAIDMFLLAKQIFYFLRQPLNKMRLEQKSDGVGNFFYQSKHLFSSNSQISMDIMEPVRIIIMVLVTLLTGLALTIVTITKSLLQGNNL